MNAATGEARPLAGRGVLVTRPRAQAAELIALLESAGATVIVAPTVRITAPADPGPLQQAAADLAQFEWIVFSSANGVDALFDAVQSARTDAVADVPRTLSRLRHTLRRGSPERNAKAAGPRGSGRAETLPKIAAVGSRTAERLHSRGVDVALVPDEFTAEALVTALTSQAALGGTRVLLPRSEIGREVLAEGLRAAGAIVTDVIAYRTVADTAGGDGADVRQLLREGRIDAVTFTSGSAVQNFAQMYVPGSIELLRRAVVAVIGPVTADAARQLGVTVHVQPPTYTTAAMVDALSDYFARRA